MIVVCVCCRLVCVIVEALSCVGSLMFFFFFVVCVRLLCYCFVVYRVLFVVGRVLFVMLAVLCVVCCLFVVCRAFLVVCCSALSGVVDYCSFCLLFDVVC